MVIFIRVLFTVRELQGVYQVGEMRYLLKISRKGQGISLILEQIREISGKLFVLVCSISRFANMLTIARKEVLQLMSMFISLFVMKVEHASLLKKQRFASMALHCVKQDGNQGNARRHTRENDFPYLADTLN